MNKRRVWISRKCLDFWPEIHLTSQKHLKMNAARRGLTRTAHGHRRAGSGLGVLITVRFRRGGCLFWDHPWKDKASFELGALLISWMKPFTPPVRTARLFQVLAGVSSFKTTKKISIKNERSLSRKRWKDLRCGGWKERFRDTFL